MTDIDPKEVVLEIISRKAGLPIDKLRLDARLLHDLHIDGDDAAEAILEIAKRCSVDVSGFDASMYFRREPSFLSLFPFLRSQRRDRVDRKRPLTVADLIQAARQGKLSGAKEPR